MLSQLAEVGEVQVESLMLNIPALDARMLVDCVVVTEDVDPHLRCNGFVDHAQDLLPLLMALPLLAQAEDFSGLCFDLAC